MKFATQYERISDKPEKRESPIIVERAGYMPADVTIQRILQAGKRLAQTKKEMYDYTLDNPQFDFFDPTRSKRYDLADASQDQQRLKKLIHKKMKLKEQRAQEELDAKNEQNPPIVE